MPRSNEAIYADREDKVTRSIEDKVTRSKDIFEPVAEWLDDGTRPVFAICSVTAAIDEVSKYHVDGIHVPTDVLNAMGASWNFFDGIAGTASAIQQFRKLPFAERRKKELAMWATMDLTLSTTLNTGTILTLLSQYHAVNGTLAIAFAPLGTVAFAACMWGSAIHAYVNLARALREQYDSVYWFKDQLVRARNLQKKIDNLDIKIDQCATGENFFNRPPEIDIKLKKLEKQKDQLQRDQARLFNQARLIYANSPENKQKAMSTLKENMKNKTQTSTMSTLKENMQNKSQTSTTNLFNSRIPSEANTMEKFYTESLSIKPNEEDKKLYQALKQTQKNETEHHVINAVNWTMAAIGMTLIAVSLFTGPAAPVILTVGVAISAVAGAMKLAEFVIPRIINRHAKRQYLKQHPEHVKKTTSRLKSKWWFDDIKDEDTLIKQSLKLSDNVDINLFFSKKQKQQILNNIYRKKTNKEQLIEEAPDAIPRLI